MPESGSRPWGSRPGRVGVVGLGLIGGSLARALLRTGAVSGHDRDPATSTLAAEAGIDVASTVEELAASVDVVVVATPLKETASVLAAVAAGTAERGDGPIVTDVGSVKFPVTFTAAQVLPPTAPFVGGHPMAGSEHSGFTASSADLYDGAPWILTLEESTDLQAFLDVGRVVVAAGARVVPISSADHDRAVAAVSHLPHVIATSLVNATAAMDDHQVMMRLAAGSYRGATRVADTRSEFTADITFLNRLPLLDALDAFAAELDRFRDLLNKAKVDEDLLPFFETPHEVRGELGAASWVETELAIDPVEDLPGSRRSLLEIGRDGGSITGISRTGNLARLRVAVPLDRGR